MFFMQLGGKSRWRLDMRDICKDLADEQAALDDIVKDLDEAGWQTITSFYAPSIK